MTTARCPKRKAFIALAIPGRWACLPWRPFPSRRARAPRWCLLGRPFGHFYFAISPDCALLFMASACAGGGDPGHVRYTRQHPFRPRPRLHDMHIPDHDHVLVHLYALPCLVRSSSTPGHRFFGNTPAGCPALCPCRESSTRRRQHFGTTTSAPTLPHHYTTLHYPHASGHGRTSRDTLRGTRHTAIRPSCSVAQARTASSATQKPGRQRRW